MMHGPGKSDSAIVAVKPTNKAGRPAAEPVERRAEAEENAGQQRTRRAQYRESVSQALDRIRQVANQRFGVGGSDLTGENVEMGQQLTHALQQSRGGFEIAGQACSSSSRAFASFKSSVSKPSVNQP